MNRTTSKQQLAAWLCGAGIILCIVGYRGVRYIPMTPEEERREELLREITPAVEEMVQKAPPEFREHMIKPLRDASIRNQPGREPPYLRAGQVALALGIGLTLFGMITWFQNTPADQRFRWTRANDDA